jgi:hypothetical protein
LYYIAINTEGPIVLFIIFVLKSASGRYRSEVRSPNFLPSYIVLRRPFIHRAIIMELYTMENKSPASSQQPAASSQQPAASSQQPAASSQQPAASSQQPAANYLLMSLCHNF